MLATLARVAALRRTGLLSRRGGGRGLWTGRPQSGILRDSVRAAKGTPAPASPLRRHPKESAGLSRSIRCPRRPPFGLSRLPLPWLRGSPVVTLPGVRARVRPLHGDWFQEPPLDTKN
ncbi:hypothetical protein J1605_013362 [Eschrichtius robustus]|uniref:Uncharacterized protein n=1 Tax=Eschrichtius robustus TaxID=9764 RepID=A0AB34GIL9_ESCRO|nr:hypothetical protein J1605_013362 [Eschrichtius robustus]